MGCNPAINTQILAEMEADDEGIFWISSLKGKLAKTKGFSFSLISQ